MHQVGEVTAVVQDQVERTVVAEDNGLVHAPDVLLIRLALPGVNGHARLGNGSSRVVLGGEDVAAGPLDLCAQLSQCLDEDSRLDGHMKAASDASSLQHLLGAILPPHLHQPGHLMLSQLNLLATNTTNTFTPTTLKTIEQMFVDVEEPETYKNQAGFAPPTLKHKTYINMDSSNWQQGGVTTVVTPSAAPPPSFELLQANSQEEEKKSEQGGREETQGPGGRVTLPGGGGEEEDEEGEEQVGRSEMQKEASRPDGDVAGRGEHVGEQEEGTAGANPAAAGGEDAAGVHLGGSQVGVQQGFL